MDIQIYVSHCLINVDDEDDDDDDDYDDDYDDDDTIFKENILNVMLSAYFHLWQKHDKLMKNMIEMLCG